MDVNPRPVVNRAALLAATALLQSCGLFGGDTSGPARIEELIGRVERVHLDAQLCQERVSTARVTLRTVVTPTFTGDALIAFQELGGAQQRTEEQAEILRASVDEMKAAAEPLFERWQADLLAFSSSEMRQRSMARLEETRSRYRAILGAVEPTQAALDAFNLGLRDVGLFLGNDFNAQAIASIQGDAKELGDLAGDLDRRFSRCLQTTREYVETTAPPAGAARPDGRD